MTTQIAHSEVSSPVVEASAKAYQDLKSQLIAEFPDLDEQTLHDTLEGLSDLQEILSAVVRSALDDEALVSALTGRLDDLKARLERIDDRAARKRRLVLRVMTETGLRKITEADFTASLRTGAPSVLIHAEAQIPAVYWKPQVPKLDKQTILAALKAGVEVRGAELQPGQPQLSVRTR